MLARVRLRACVRGCVRAYEGRWRGEGEGGDTGGKAGGGGPERPPRSKATESIHPPSQTLNMPRERWVGYIKDYDGGTLMECYVHPTIDYTAVPEMIKTQKAFVNARIKAMSQQHVVYDGMQLGGGVKVCV